MCDKHKDHMSSDPSQPGIKTGHIRATDPLDPLAHIDTRSDGAIEINSGMIF